MSYTYKLNLDGSIGGTYAPIDMSEVYGITQIMPSTAWRCVLADWLSPLPWKMRSFPAPNLHSDVKGGLWLEKKWNTCMEYRCTK